MSTEIQSTSYARRPSAAVRWRDFCEQWRHSYLLLAVVFWFLWRAALLPMERLENTRIAGGLHPVDVLLLMRMLKLMWAPPLVAAVIYGASFVIPRLNTPSAIAVSALSSTALLAFVLLCALMNIGISI